jgi:hypothetical protein
MRAPWEAPNAAGVLGPRPGAAHQAYSVTATPPNWDQYAMLNAALNNISLQQANGGEGWVMNTGASSHVSGTTSNLYQFTSSPVHSPHFHWYSQRSLPLPMIAGFIHVQVTI